MLTPTCRSCLHRIAPGFTCALDEGEEMQEFYGAEAAEQCPFFLAELAPGLDATLGARVTQVAALVAQDAPDRADLQAALSDLLRLLGDCCAPHGVAVPAMQEGTP